MPDTRKGGYAQALELRADRFENKNISRKKMSTKYDIHYICIYVKSIYTHILYVWDMSEIIALWRQKL